MATIKDLANRYGLEDYKQLLGGYPNAEKFITGLKDAAVRSVPTTEQMRDPNFIIDTAGLGGAIKAYHGTPHLFDRFDMSKIGTGEGAQSYGHGLYLAQDPSIAESYRKKLSDAEYKTKRGGDLPYGWKSSINEMRRNGKSHEDVVNFLQGIAEKQTHPNWKAAKKLNERIQKGNVVYSDPGRIYETSIQWPNAEREAIDPLGEHHLLDWDQPAEGYVQESIPRKIRELQNARDAISSKYVDDEFNPDDLFSNTYSFPSNEDKAAMDKIAEEIVMHKNMSNAFEKGAEGSVIYNKLIKMLGSPEKASEYLHTLDIPGIKYLDASSRNTDKGTRNFVTFGDEYPQIVKRAGSLDELKEKYAEGGIVKAQDQNENLGRLAEMLGSARDIGNEYKVPSWVPLAGGTGAGDLLMGRTPEEIENWSYGNAPMQIPEMSNVPQFKRGRAQSLADALTTLAPGVKATEGLPAGLSFIGPKSRNWDKVAAELAAKKLDEGADPAEVWREHLIGRMPDKTLFSEISDYPASFKGVGSFGDVVMNRLDALQNAGKKTIDDPMNVADIFTHRDLAESYPELFPSTEIRFLSKDDKSKGSMQVMDDGTNILKMPYDATRDKTSTMLHELQHAIQSKEGWTRGGSPGQFVPELIDMQDAAYEKIKSLNSDMAFISKQLDKVKESKFDMRPELYEKKLNNLKNKYDELMNERDSHVTNAQLDIPSEAFKRYKNLAGEAQARATQDRLDMDMAQRRENYPLAGGKLSDIPLEELIYKYEGNGPSLSADPLSKYKDYVGEHSAPLGDSGAPLHDLTANENAIYPSDVYSSQANQYYGSGEPEDAQLFAMAQRLKTSQTKRSLFIVPYLKYKAIVKRLHNLKKI